MLIRICRSAWLYLPEDGTKVSVVTALKLTKWSNIQYCKCPLKLRDLHHVRRFFHVFCVVVLIFHSCIMSTEIIDFQVCNYEIWQITLLNFLKINMGLGSSNRNLNVLQLQKNRWYSLKSLQLHIVSWQMFLETMWFRSSLNLAHLSRKLPWHKR